MSNHYDGLDYIVLASLFPSPLRTVVKADLVGNPHDANLLSLLFSYVKGAMLNSLNFIPYKRGDKEDGSLVKNVIVDTLATGSNILIFPEGDTRKDGVPKDFKNGIFHLALANKSKILPITLKYAKNIGWVAGESLDMIKWLDNDVDVYIHDVINSEEESSFLSLKEKTFDAICMH